MPVRDVDVKMIVPGDFEKRDAAIVLHGTVGLEMANSRFQRRHLRPPRASQKLLCGRNTHTTSAGAL
jgi:hypothetical protein